MNINKNILETYQLPSLNKTEIDNSSLSKYDNGEFNLNMN